MSGTSAPAPLNSSKTCCPARLHDVRTSLGHGRSFSQGEAGREIQGRALVRAHHRRLERGGEIEVEALREDAEPQTAAVSRVPRRGVLAGDEHASDVRQAEKAI